MSNLIVSIELWIWFLTHIGVGVMNYMFLHKLQSREAKEYPVKLAIPNINLNVAKKLTFDSGTAHLMYAVFVITGIMFFDWVEKPLFQSQFIPGIFIFWNIKYIYDLWIAVKRYVVVI